MSTVSGIGTVSAAAPGVSGLLDGPRRNEAAALARVVRRAFGRRVREPRELGHEAGALGRRRNAQRLRHRRRPARHRHVLRDASGRAEVHRKKYRYNRGASNEASLHSAQCYVLPRRSFVIRPRGRTAVAPEPCLHGVSQLTTICRASTASEPNYIHGAHQLHRERHYGSGGSGARPQASGHVHRGRRRGRAAPPRLGDSGQLGRRGDEWPRLEHPRHPARRRIVDHHRG